MPSPITALFHDPRLEEIRLPLVQRTEEVPFFLMPVRIETRFKKVVKPQIGANISLEDALEEMLHLVVQGANVGRDLSGASIITYSSEVMNMYAALAKMPPTTEPQQGWFKQLLLKVQDAIVFIDLHANPVLKSLTQELNNAFIKLAGVVDVLSSGVKPSNVPEPAFIENNSRKQLWVRLYPDDIFVKTHEPGLTASELDSGRAFWKSWWAASENKDLESGAWNTLCTATGSTRASWITRVLSPVNSPSAKNKAALDAKPSLSTTRATEEIQATYDLLCQITVFEFAMDFFRNLRSTTPFGGMERSYDRVISGLGEVKTEQDFLLEKFRFFNEGSKSIISIFLGKAAELTPEQQAIYKNEIDSINIIAGKLNDISHLFSDIKPVDLNEFTESLPEPFEYPEVAIKEKDWSVAPHTDCLPSRFAVVILSNGAFSHIATGRPCAQTIQLGLDPNKFNDPSAFRIDDSGNLLVDEGLKWMTDYEEAVKCGLGITIEITDQEFQFGMDQLVVIGIRDADAITSKNEVEDLFTNHIYSAQGMSFLKVGTPTNNTHHNKSFLQANGDVEQRFDIEVNNKKYNPLENDKFKSSDGKILSEALGLDHSVLQHANNNDNREISNAFVMNRALWGAGMGHFFEEICDSLVTYDNTRRIEDFFTNYCFGRGMLPSVQIGNQPYGIMVTTAFSRFEVSKVLPKLEISELASLGTGQPIPAELENRLQVRFDMRLQKVLKVLNNIWLNTGRTRVTNSAGFFNGDQQQKFINMLGLHATSLEYFFRYSVNTPEPNSASQYDSNAGLNKDGEFYGPVSMYQAFKDLMLEGVFAPSFGFLDENHEFIRLNSEAKILAARIARIQNQFSDSRVFSGKLVNNTHLLDKNIIDIQPLSVEDHVGRIQGTDQTYFDWLLSKPATDLYGNNELGNPAKFPSHCLLFLMLRQSLMQCYQEAALNILEKENMLFDSFRRKIGNIDSFIYKQVSPQKFQAEYVTKWQVLFNNLDQIEGSIALPPKENNQPFYDFMTGQFGPKNMASYLDAVRDSQHLPGKIFRQSHVAEFNKMSRVREAIQTLKKVPAAEMETLFAEHIDLCSYRLDAWTLGMANKRLFTGRGTQPSGLFVGAYGYVENLKPATGRQTLTETDRLKEFNLEPGKPVYVDSDNQGFIHAPSINQAITAAVLRSASRANAAGDVANRLSVNISSSRVRMALDLLEGIRNGQELGAILGYQFERGLHERYQIVELDKFIQPFRKAYPLAQQVQETTNGSPAYVSQVANGSLILEDVYAAIKWLDFPSGETVGNILKKDNYKALPAKMITIINAAMQPGDPTTPIFDAIVEEIDRMADAFDALGDLAISESVYQVVQGNHVRAAAVLSAMAQGKNIPDPQVIATNRTGTVITHRVILNLPVTGSSLAVPAGWNARGSYRSFTEPNLNFWLGTVIGDPALVKCVITSSDANGRLLKESFSLKDLGWQPIDLFALPGGENELKDIIKNLSIFNNQPRLLNVDIDFNERGADWQPADKNFTEVLLTLRHVRNLLGNAKAAGASDLLGPDAVTDKKNSGNFDIAEFGKRIKTALKSLQALNASISSEPFVSKVLSGEMAAAAIIAQPGDFQKVLAHLTNALMMGLPNALSLPLAAESGPQEQFTNGLVHLLSVLKESTTRETAALGILAIIDGTSNVVLLVDKLRELARAVFGKNFMALPLYSPASKKEIQTQLSLPEEGSITRHEGPAASENWLQSIGRVRKNMYELSMFRQMQDMNDVPVTSLQPVQFPYSPGDYWLGCEYPADHKPQGDKLSLVMVNETVFEGQLIQAGLILDEWLEVIPGKEETSGITFHYNQPGVTAPQSILLAVKPDATERWHWDDLVHTIIDTIALAKSRGVEPDHVGTGLFNHVLPAIVSEVVPPKIPNQAEAPMGIQVQMDFADVIKP